MQRLRRFSIKALFASCFPDRIATAFESRHRTCSHKFDDADLASSDTISLYDSDVEELRVGRFFVIVMLFHLVSLIPVICAGMVAGGSPRELVPHGVAQFAILATILWLYKREHITGKTGVLLLMVLLLVPHCGFVIIAGGLRAPNIWAVPTLGLQVRFSCAIFGVAG